MEKAVKDGSRSMVEIPVVGSTIAHTVKGHFGAANVVLVPASPGTGVIAGSAVRAVVMLKDGTQATAEEIIEFCKDKMAGYKRPKSVLFADSFPISPVGKVLG